MTPALACVHMNSSAARATCAPGRGSDQGERGDPARDRAVEQPVPGRIELDLVDALAEAIVGDQPRLVALGPPRMGLRVRRGGDDARLADPLHRPLGALARQRLPQRGVALEQVDVLEGNRLVQTHGPSV